MLPALTLHTLQLYSVLKATVAAILLRSAAIKEQGQMLAMMPYVHQLATGLVELLEQPAAARQLRASLQRLRMPGAIGEEQAALPYEHLLFACYLLRWQATLALLFTPELPTPDGGREAAMRTNLQAGQRMAQLLPDSPMGHYITSKAGGAAPSQMLLPLVQMLLSIMRVQAW